MESAKSYDSGIPMIDGLDILNRPSRQSNSDESMTNTGETELL